MIICQLRVVICRLSTAWGSYLSDQEVQNQGVGSTDAIAFENRRIKRWEWVNGCWNRNKGGSMQHFYAFSIFCICGFFIHDFICCKCLNCDLSFQFPCFKAYLAIWTLSLLHAFNACLFYNKKKNISQGEYKIWTFDIANKFPSQKYFVRKRQTISQGSS